MAAWLKGLLIAGAFAATTKLVPDHVNYDYALEEDWPSRAAWLRAHWPKLSAKLPSRGRSTRTTPLPAQPIRFAWQDQTEGTESENLWDTASWDAQDGLEAGLADAPLGPPIGAVGGDLDEEQWFDLLQLSDRRAIDAALKSRSDPIASLVDNLQLIHNFYQYETDAAESPAATVPEPGTLALLALPALFVRLLKPRGRTHSIGRAG